MSNSLHVLIEQQGGLTQSIKELEEQKVKNNNQIEEDTLKLKSLEEQKQQPRNVHSEGEDIDQKITALNSSIVSLKAENVDAEIQIKAKKNELKKLSQDIKEKEAEEESIRIKAAAEAERKQKDLEENRKYVAIPRVTIFDEVEKRNKQYKYISKEHCEYMDNRTGEIIELEAGIEMFHWCFGPVKIEYFEEREANSANKVGGDEKIIVGKVDILHPEGVNFWGYYGMSSGTRRVKLAFLFIDKNDELFNRLSAIHGAYSW